MKASEVIKKFRNLFFITDLEKWRIAEQAGAIDFMEFYFIEMQEKGGKCDICEKQWKKKENSIIEYYEPSCQCYPRCPFCRRWMIFEVKNKLSGCRYCGKDGIGCWKIKPVMKTDEDGNKTPTGKWKNCNGVLRLQPVRDGYTIYKCDRCELEMKRKIL